MGCGEPSGGKLLIKCTLPYTRQSPWMAQMLPPNSSGPEQHDGAPHGYSGTSADVWSLGLTLFEALVGARAFDGHVLPAYEDYRRISRPTQ